MQKNSKDFDANIEQWSNFWGDALNSLYKSNSLWQDWWKTALNDYWGVSVNPNQLGDVFQKLYAAIISDPETLTKIQVEWMERVASVMDNTLEGLLDGELRGLSEQGIRDRRFRDETWQQHPLFHTIKEIYCLNAESLLTAVGQVGEMDPRSRQKLVFYMRQYVDALSPSNFILTNPEVLRETLERKGENLVEGFNHFLEDVSKGNGNLQISMADFDAFEVGKTIACTPGKVMFENKLLQLIQYEPTTEQVYKRPLLMVPAWINKFYIMDLQAKNSYVKWLVDQGYTVFIVSWINPDGTYRDVTMDEYLTDGLLEALDAVKRITGEPDVNMIGYCLGGSMLTVLMSYLEQKGQAERIHSATLLTTLLDFSEPGEMGVFIDDEQVTALEEKMQREGLLEGKDMMLTFNLLRANELIWSFFINNYLMGKEPFPFDLLYWNADATNIPAATHSMYLRRFYLENKLTRSGELKMGGVPVDLSQVKTPIYFLSCYDDHIAPWKSTYRGRKLVGGASRFVLAGSGHVAGVINPPAKEKYCYWTHDSKPDTTGNPDTWLTSADQHTGSWWPDWAKWNRQFAGDKVKARVPGEGKIKPIEAAPGRYVKVRVS